MKRIRWLLMVMVAVFNTACTYSSLSITGRVVDKETNKPIENYVVMVTWVGYVSTFVSTINSCYNIEVVLTDKDGRYKTKPWLKNTVMVSGKQRYICAFKDGYEFGCSGGKVDVALEKFKGDDNDYVEMLGRYMSAHTSCIGDRYNDQKRYRYLVRVRDDLVSFCGKYYGKKMWRFD